ncbi:MAG: M81 family metallopeptidase [Fuerstiella sp.]|nr:M81 family metallopeptidase [Fuerstiella sp.]
MIQRILIAELKQETATFNPVPTLYDDFRIVVGDAMLSDYHGTQTEVAGAMDVFTEEGDIRIVPGMAALAVSGGPIPAADLDRLIDELSESVRRAGSVDAVCLCFHGAMAGDTEGDPEGRALTEIREIVGNIPLVISLDLHAVLTDRLIDYADVLIPYHTYPHTDHYETGRRAARILLGLLNGTAKPSVARVRLPMLVRGDELLTATGRFGEAIRMCQSVESSERGLAAGVIIGNAFTDVPALQSNVIVTTNDDPDLARHEAERIGRLMWDSRELFQANLVPLEESIRLAEQTDGLVVFSDAADATSSGASGDSNAILCGLLKTGFTKQALLAIVDVPAVAVAFDAGPGAVIDVSLGGTRDPERFDPVQITARVVNLYNGEFTYEDGTEAHAGRVCVLTVGTISILVTERPVFLFGLTVFTSHDLHPQEFDLVAVKSPNGFRTWYESISSLIVPVDVPGSTSANLKSLPFENCVRPIFPLDEDVPSPFQ